MGLFDWKRGGKPGTDATERAAPTAIEVVRAYHERTKHAPGRYARGPGGLDWDNQPDPFRRWVPCPSVPLERLPPDKKAAEALRYTQVFRPELLEVAPLDARSLSRLLYDSFALSAWKEYEGSRWALRVNPSSGNLHPTEVHLLFGAVAGLTSEPSVAHYAAREHALELRARLSDAVFATLQRDLGPGSLLVALTSIHWREAWKYGERAWRYCQHDAGHALAALALSAAALGWRARVVEQWAHRDIAKLLGLEAVSGHEAESVDMLVAITPRSPAPPQLQAPSNELRAAMGSIQWTGMPSQLSAEYVDWDVIEAVAMAAQYPGPQPDRARAAALEAPQVSGDTPLEPPAGPPWRALVHHRRSAVSMDGSTTMAAEDFFAVMRRLLPGGEPFASMPWGPAVDLVVFVHRVEGLGRGLYVLVRSPARQADLRQALRHEFAWKKPAGAQDLPLFLLHAADMRGLAAHASCDQAIAGDGCFSLGMLADMRTIDEDGAWRYPQLFWEAGAIGQVLYLEAEALNLRGTGIGCYYDDVVHAALGLASRNFQSLYHFAFGAPVEDRRLSTLPAYD